MMDATHVRGMSCAPRNLSAVTRTQPLRNIPQGGLGG
jgi:hypothetical protein